MAIKSSGHTRKKCKPITITRKAILSLFVFTLLTSIAVSQTVIPLYKDKVPNSIAGPNLEIWDTIKSRILVRKVSSPTLTAYFPDKEKANGTALLIIPGGGYHHVEISNVGFKVAEEFIKFGVTCFVLKYRLPNDTTMVKKEIGPLQDAQQALKLIRERAKEWNIDPSKVGVAGFSAGGHVASMLATHFTNAVIENNEHANLRPDFQVLLWPVISMADSLMHKGSRDLLLGKSPSPKMILEYSPELHVNAETPPAFLAHAGDDKSVKVTNSLLYYQALQKNNVMAELHIYPKGGHGFGLINPTTPDRWSERCRNWMISNGY
jgi:acetyl esterase/lipase